MQNRESHKSHTFFVKHLQIQKWSPKIFISKNFFEGGAALPQFV